MIKDYKMQLTRQDSWIWATCEDHSIEYIKWNKISRNAEHLTRKSDWKPCSDHRKIQRKER